VSRYEVLLFLHIAAATVWLGAAVTVQLLIFRAERAADQGAMQATGEGADWLATRLFIPASLSVLVLGVLLVVDGPWGFDELWILLGLAGYAASFLTGILYFQPEGERVTRGIAAHGPDDPDVRQRLRRLSAVSWLEIVILFLVLADMALKPTSDDLGTLVVGAAVLLAAAAVAARSLRTPHAEADRPPLVPE
jgi:uncharacterized membrane protein